MTLGNNPLRLLFGSFFIAVILAFSSSLQSSDNLQQPNLSEHYKTGHGFPPNPPESPPPEAAPKSAPVESHNPPMEAGAPAALFPVDGADRSATLDAKIGQMIMAGFEGTSVRHNSVRQIQALLREGLIGGVVLLGRNVQNSAQLRALTEHLQRAAGSGFPALIAIDQEGGAVQRLHTATGSAQRLARKYRRDPGQAEEIYTSMARQLALAGVNVNFGPVVDLDITGARNPIIGRLGRSYGKDPEQVIQYASLFIAAHNKFGILTAAKHFPGHGSSVTDTHKGFADISRTWRREELEPFAHFASPRAGRPVDMIMVGHLYHGDFSDRRGEPASLSKSAIQNWLRRRLKFEGVVITDDLEMGAIARKYQLAEAVVRAINAGNDIVLFSATAPGAARKVHGVIKKAVQQGRIPQARMDEAYGRIAGMKKRLKKKTAAASH